MSQYKNYINGREVEDEEWGDSSEDGVHQICVDGNLQWECIQNHQEYERVRVWSDNGQLVYERFYQNGEVHGLDRRWFNDGRLYRKHIFVNGIERPELLSHDMRLARIAIFGKDILEENMEDNSLNIEVPKGRKIPTRLGIVRMLNRQSRERWSCSWLKAVKKIDCCGCCIGGKMWKDLLGWSRLLDEDDSYYVKDVK